MTQDYVFQAVSKRTADQLKLRIPELSVEAFTGCVNYYRFQQRRGLASPSTAQRHFDEVAEQSFHLLSEVEAALSTPGLAEYLALACVDTADSSLLQRIVPDLRALAGAAEHARREAERLTSVGRSLAPRTRLIHRLAEAIEAVGLKADARNAGPLVLAFGIALDEIGESIADPKGSVKSALQSLSGGE